MDVISTKDTKLTGINLKLATVRHVCASIILVSNSFTHDNLLIILDRILVILLASSFFKFSKPFVIVKLCKHNFFFMLLSLLHLVLNFRKN